VKFGGLKFLDAAHVKDLLAFLRWSQNPRDRVAGFRVLQLLPGFGPKTAGKLLEEMGQAEEPSVALLGFGVPAAAREAWPAVAQTLQGLRSRHLGWPAELEAVRRWYQPHLERLHEDAQARGADLDQLERIAATFPSRERFITELTLDPPDATSDESGVPLRDEDYLILSTIHSAKGQEWRSVFLLNAVDGCLPSDLATGTTEEIDEERRLLYVAMTRAKDELRVIVPQRFYVHQQSAQGDRHVYASRTRFIPAELLPLFESRAWPETSGAGADAVAAAQARVDIAARLRGMWR
jgi:DNA helicase-2/ATP-dependent DNA helicase PcrA